MVELITSNIVNNILEWYSYEEISIKFIKNNNKNNIRRNIIRNFR
jgi:hypothetical protein